MIDVVFDLSHFNAVDDLRPAARAGFLGVIHKATQGTGYVDKTFEARRALAQAAGLMFGTYHFGTGTAPGVSQAAFYLKTVGPRLGELLMLDLEANTGGASMTLAQGEDFVTAVHAAVGAWPVLYAGSYLKDQLRGGIHPGPALRACPLFLAQYGPAAVLPVGWADWSLWQYSDGRVNAPAAPVPGVGACDRDRFNGTADQLRAFWAAHAATVPPPD